MTRKPKANRSATERLSRIVRAALTEQGLTEAEAAREARLPEKVFRSLLQHGHRPSLDRADELLRAVQCRMTLGAEDPKIEDERGGGSRNP